MARAEERPRGQAPRPDRVQLKAVRVAGTPSDRPTLDVALRLLATWAVRSARGQTQDPEADLTVCPPGGMNGSGTEAEEST